MLTRNSNFPPFFMADAPYCKPDQTQVFGVAREETVRISCEVVANPVGQTSFEWRFNASNGDSGEMVDMPHDRFRSTNSKVPILQKGCSDSGSRSRLGLTLFPKGVGVLLWVQSSRIKKCSSTLL